MIREFCAGDSVSPTFLKQRYGMGTVSPITNVPATYDSIATLSSGSPVFVTAKFQTPTCVFIDSIPLRGTQVELSRPIVGVVRLRDNYCSVENEELGLFTVKKDLSECLREFKQDISFLLSEYGEESEDALTEDARQLKRKILEYVDE